MPLLAHIMGTGSKFPDPIKFLLVFTIPENSFHLKRFLGLFVYNAKWVEDHSIKVVPLLAAQKQLAFPLTKASEPASETLKAEVASAVLWLPRTNEPQTDASGTGIAATLIQATKLSASSREP